MGDKRTDSGQFYPGGKVIPQQPVTPGGGADPNAVHYTADRNKTDAQKAQARANIGAMAANTPIPSVDGKLPVKQLPKYLHALSFDDTYPADAEAWYESLAPDAMGGACSAVRRGGKLWRNYDWTFDNSAEFVVLMSAAEGRHASVGVASLGAALSEDEVASGVYTAKYRALPGMTLDGINDAGVVAEINVDGGPKTGWHGDADDGGIHILAAVRWVLDHGETAEQAAEWLADHIIQPQGDMNFHFTVADATKTYIVENGVAHDVTDGVKVLTNYALYDEAHAGGGKERYQLLAGGADISAVNWTNSYQPGNDWDSDFDSHEQHLSAIERWAEQGAMKEAHRDKTTESGNAWWQTVHTSEYDFAAKTMKVAVQESDEWFTFAVGGAKVELDDEVTQASANGVKSSGIWSWVKSLLPSWLTAESGEPRRKTDLDVYEQKWVFSGPAVDAGNQYRLEINYYEPSGRYDVDLYRVGFDEMVDHLDSDTPDIKHVDMADTYLGLGVVGDLLDVKTPSKLAHTSATSGLAKMGAGGELTAATPSSTGGANADYRDPLDNVCHKTEYGEWDYTDDYPWRLTYGVNNSWTLEHDTGAGYYTIADYSGGKYATTITLKGGEPGLPEELHRQRFATDGEMIVTVDVAARSLSCGDGASKQTVSVADGAADVSDFFRNSNTLLTSTIDARLPYPLNTDGTIKDRAVNEVTSGAFVIPEGFKDLLIRYTGVPTSLTFSGTDASIADYGDDLPTETGDYLITVTRTKAAECYIRIVTLEASA